MHVVERKQLWRLTINYYPAAVAAGVAPTPSHGDFDPHPRYYSPHEIDFLNPPTRDEFLAVVRDTPWMAVWNHALLPDLARSEWPYVEVAKKAATTKIVNASGDVVGGLEVRRYHLFANAGYYRVSFNAQSARLIDTLPAKHRNDAGKAVEARANRIGELLAKTPADVYDFVLEHQINAVVRGFVKSRQGRHVCGTCGAKTGSSTSAAAT